LQTTAGAGGVAGACAATPAVTIEAKSAAEISDMRFIESLLQTGLFTIANGRHRA
jgi:hypothetical protein